MPGSNVPEPTAICVVQRFAATVHFQRRSVILFIIPANEPDLEKIRNKIMQARPGKDSGRLSN